MIVEIVDNLGKSTPVRLHASQVTVFTDSMTPIMIAGVYGPDGVIKLAHVEDDDFTQTLQAFGVGRHQIHVKSLRTSAPPDGARAIYGPGSIYSG